VFNSRALNGGCDFSTAHMFLQLTIAALPHWRDSNNSSSIKTFVLAGDSGFVTIGHTNTKH
jgi:hypothetical protein